MNLIYLLIGLIVLLLFIITCIIIITVKNSGINKKSTNYDGGIDKNGNYNIGKTYSFNEETKYNVTQDFNSNNSIHKKKGLKPVVIISSIIISIGVIFVMMSAIVFYSYSLKHKISHTINNKNINEQDNEKRLNNISLNDGTFLDQDYNSLFNQMVKSMNLKGEILFNRIYLSVDEENSSIKYIDVSFIAIENGKYTRHEVRSRYDYNLDKTYFEDSSYGEASEFNKSDRKRYMTIEEGSELFTKYINLIDVNKKDADINFKADKYTSVDDFYNENEKQNRYKYYLVDLDNQKISPMPQGYKENSYGVYSVLTVECFDSEQDIMYKDNYVKDWQN